MPKAALEASGEVSVKAEYPRRFFARRLRSRPGSAGTPLTETGLVFFLAPYNYLSPHPCSVVTREIIRRLGVVGVTSSKDPQRLQAVQRHGTCEMKSTLAVLSHSMSDNAYQIFRMAMLYTAYLTSCDLQRSGGWESSRVEIPEEARRVFVSQGITERGPMLRDLGRQTTAALAKKLDKNVASFMAQSDMVE